MTAPCLSSPLVWRQILNFERKHGLCGGMLLSVHSSFACNRIIDDSFVSFLCPLDKGCCKVDDFWKCGVTLHFTFNNLETNERSPHRVRQQNRNDWHKLSFLKKEPKQPERPNAGYDANQRNGKSNLDLVFFTQTIYDLGIGRSIVLMFGECAYLFVCIE